MKNIYLLLIVSAISFRLLAQSDTSGTQLNDGPKVEVTMTDGNIIRGTLLSENEKEVNVLTEFAGKVTIPRSKVVEVKLLDSSRPGSQATYINLASRYYFSPSGMNMKKGDGYYQNVWFFFNSFNYAVTDHFSIGGGFESFSLLFGKPIFFFTPKVNYDISENIHVGLSYLHFNYSMVQDDPEATGSLNLVSGCLTFGNPDQSVTVNYGQDLSHNGGTIVTVSGFLKTGMRFGLMTENWIFTSNDSYGLYSFGGRVIGRKNLFDFGIITNTDIMSEGWLGIPFLSYTLRF